MSTKQNKTNRKATPPVKVWPETYRKLATIAKKNQWKLVVAFDNAANALGREQQLREKQPA